jgi:predicted Zn-dependent peptidase
MHSIEKLNNGLTLITLPIKDVETAGYGLLVPAGLSGDPSGKAGLSSVMVELSSRSAAGLSQKEFQGRFDDYGISHSERALNDYCLYASNCLADKIDKSLEFLADMILRSDISEEAFPAVKSLFLQEIQSQEDEAMQKALKEFNRQYFNEPFNRQTPGWYDDLNSLTIEEVKNAYKATLCPGNSLLVVAGNVNAAQIKDKVNAVFSSWGPRSSKLPSFEAKKEKFKTHINFDSQQIQIVFGFDAPNMTAADYYTGKVLNSVLSGGMFGRMFSEVREKRGLCYTVFSAYRANRFYGRFTCYAGTTTERARETFEVMQKVLLDAASNLEFAELERAKTDLLSATILSRETTAARGRELAEDWWQLGRIRTLDEIRQAVHAVGREEIEAFVNNYLKNEFSLLTLGSQSIF